MLRNKAYTDCPSASHTQDLVSKTAEDTFEMCIHLSATAGGVRGNDSLVLLLADYFIFVYNTRKVKLYVRFTRACPFILFLLL